MAEAMQQHGVDQSQSGPWSVLDVYGEVELSWSPDLRQEVLAVLANSSALAVRLARVTYIDSSGIAALVEGFQRARSHHQRFVLLSPSPPVRSVLESARLDRVFPIFPDLAAATAAGG